MVIVHPGDGDVACSILHQWWKEYDDGAVEKTLCKLVDGACTRHRVQQRDVNGRHWADDCARAC